MKRNREQLKELIAEHWLYTQKIMEMMYKNAFRHGYKHGIKDMEKKE